MFCVLNVRERNNSLFEKVFGCLIKDEYTVRSIPVFKGAPFFMLDVCVGKKGVSWEKVIFEVGRCASRLVTKSQVVLPPDMNVGIFNSTILYDKMMKNTFLNILEYNELKRNPLSVSVMDENAEYTDFVEKLSEYASTMSITTCCKEKYFAVCEGITESSGLCPVLKREFDDAKIKINTKKNIMTVNCCNENINISSGQDFKVPDIYENLLPEKVERYNFFSALYELCGVFSLGECVFDTINVNNEKKSIQDIHFS